MAGQQADVTLIVGADTTSAQEAVNNIKLKPVKMTFQDGVSRPLGTINKGLNDFDVSMRAATSRIAAFGISMKVINSVSNSFSQMVKNSAEVEARMNEIGVIANTTSQNLDKFRSSMVEVAQRTGKSFGDVADAAVEFVRQGLGMEETLKRTENALILTRLASLSFNDSVKTITAAINGFNREALNSSDVVNKIAAVEAAFAINAKDLSDAITRAGSTAADASVDFNQLLAAVTSVQQQTARGGNIIGTALQTIFTRIGRKTTIDSLKDLGVQIDYSMDGMEKLKAIAEGVARADAVTGNQIKQLTAGVRQMNVATALLNDLNREYGFYTNALETANKASTEAIDRNDQLNKSLSVMTMNLGTQFKELSARIGDVGASDTLKYLVTGLTTVGQKMTDILKGDSEFGDLGKSVGENLVKGLGNFIIGPGGAFLVKTIASLSVKMGKEFFSSLKSMAGMNAEADKQRLLQQSIGQILTQNSGLMEQYKKGGASAAEVQQRILNTITQQVREAELLNKTVMEVTKNAAGINLVAKSLPSGGARLAIPRKATGFVPNAASGVVDSVLAEQMSIASGVGGARRGDNPRIIPNFNFGNRVGPLVVHSGEKVVDRFMGGKASAVFNRDMIREIGGESQLKNLGDVRNVASGFIPNAADGINPKLRLEALGISIRNYEKEINEALSKIKIDKGVDSLTREMRDVIGDKVFGRAFSDLDRLEKQAANKYIRSYYGAGDKKDVREISRSLIYQQQQRVGRDVAANAEIQAAIKARKEIADASQASIYTKSSRSNLDAISKTLAYQDSTQEKLIKAGEGRIGEILSQQRQKAETPLTIIKDSSRKASPELYAEYEKRIQSEANRVTRTPWKPYVVPEQITKGYSDKISLALDKAFQKQSDYRGTNIRGTMTLGGVGNLIGPNPTETEFLEIKKQLTERVRDANRAFAAQSRKNFAIQSDKAGKVLSSSGFLGSLFGTTKGVESQVDFSGMTNARKQEVRKQIAQGVRSNRQRALNQSQLPIMFGASMAQPFVSSWRDSARGKDGEWTGGSATLGAASGALTGVSYGAIFGPWGMAIGGLAGAVAGLVSELNDGSRSVEALTEGFKNMVAQNQANIDAATGYMNTQAKLNDIISGGGKVEDIVKLSEELNNLFSQIGDEKLRRTIMDTASDTTKLGDAIGVFQRDILREQNRRAMTVLAAQEGDKVSGGVIKLQDLNSVIGAISKNIDESNIEDFSKAIEEASKNLSEDTFATAISKLGIETKEAAEMFRNLGEAVNSSRVVSGLKERVESISRMNQLNKEMVKEKQAIADMTGLIKAISSYRHSQREAAIEDRGLGFSLRQNQAKIASQQQYRYAGEYAQAQLSTGFDIQNIRFEAEQKAASEINKLTEVVRDFTAQNKDVLERTNKDLLDKLNDFGMNAQGDVRELAKEIQERAFSTDTSKFLLSEFSTKLNPVVASLESIEKSADNQVEIAKQNLKAAQERIRTENLIGAAGGIGGRAGYGETGTPNFNIRDFLMAQAQAGGAFGFKAQNDLAKAILQFKESFNGLEEFDVEKILPGSRETVERTDRENIIAGLLRDGVKIDDKMAVAIYDIAKKSTDAKFAPKVLTEENVRNAIIDAQTRLKVDTVDSYAKGIELSGATEMFFNVKAANAGIDRLYKLLDEKRGKQENFLSAKKSQSELIKERTDEGVRLRQAESELSRLKVEKGVINTSSIDVSKLGIDFKASVLKETGFGSAEVTDAHFSQEIGRWIKNSKDLNEMFTLFETGANRGSFKKGDKTREALVSTFGSDILGTDVKTGKFYIPQRGREAAIERLSNAGMELSLNPEDTAELQARIDYSKNKIGTLDQQIDTFKFQLKELSKTIEGFNNRNALSSAGSGYIAPTRPGSWGIPSAINTSHLDFSSAAPVSPQEDAKKIAAVAESVSSASKAWTQEMLFGASTVADISRANTELNDALSNLGKAAENGAESLRGLEAARDIAKFNYFKSVGRGFLEAGEMPSNEWGLTKEDIFSRTRRAGLDAGVSDIATKAADVYLDPTARKSDFIDAGMRVGEYLKQGYDSLIATGVSPEAAKQWMVETRKRIEGEWEQSGVKLKAPTGMFEQFGSGFVSQLDKSVAEMEKFGELGAKVANDIGDGFASSFTDALIHGKSFSDGMRSMLASLTEDLARHFAKLAIMKAGSSIFGEGFAKMNTGGSIEKKASGGDLSGRPALVMGGEYHFDKQTVGKYGTDFFKALNSGQISIPKFADGGQTSGLIKGGSGNRDDLLGNFQDGAFILRKSMVQKYGTGFLNSLVDGGKKYEAGGKVQRAFIGSIIGGAAQSAAQNAIQQAIIQMILQATIGAAIAKMTGGDWKKGALIGGISGAISGGVGGYMSYGGGASGAVGGGTEVAKASNVSATAPTTFSSDQAAAFTGFDKAASMPSLADTPKISTYSSDVRAAYQGFDGAKGMGKTPWWNSTKAKGLMDSAKYMGVSSAMSVASAWLNRPKEDKPKEITLEGSSTTSNYDGSVIVSDSKGTRLLRPGVDFQNEEDLKKLIATRGYAGGGIVRTPSGTISVGKGIGDDVLIMAQNGEVVMNKTASRIYNRNGLLDRMNAASITPYSASKQIAGIKGYAEGGEVGSGGSITFGTGSDDDYSNSSGDSYVFNINVSVGADGSIESSVDSENANERGEMTAERLRVMMKEFVESEKRSGGSLSKNNMG